MPDSPSPALRVFDSAPRAVIRQPTARHTRDGLRGRGKMPALSVMADDSCQTRRDASELARSQAADVLNVYVVEAGGLVAAAQIFAFAGALDIPCIIGSQAEMGIGTAPCPHRGVAVTNLRSAWGCFGPGCD